MSKGCRLQRIVSFANQAIVVLHPLAARDYLPLTAVPALTVKFEIRGSNKGEKDRSFLFYNICRKCFAGGAWEGLTFYGATEAEAVTQPPGTKNMS